MIVVDDNDDNFYHYWWSLWQEIIIPFVRYERYVVDCSIGMFVSQFRTKSMYPDLFLLMKMIDWWWRWWWFGSFILSFSGVWIDTTANESMLLRLLWYVVCLLVRCDAMWNGTEGWSFTHLLNGTTICLLLCVFWCCIHLVRNYTLTLLSHYILQKQKICIVDTCASALLILRVGRLHSIIAGIYGIYWCCSNSSFVTEWNGAH